MFVVWRLRQVLLVAPIAKDAEAEELVYGVFDFLIGKTKRTEIEFGQFRRIIGQGEAVTFYNWECPIRSDLMQGRSALEFQCRFLDNEEAVDRTRAVCLVAEEREFVENVVSPLRTVGMQVSYYKFLADTNPEILYPETVSVDVQRTLFSFGRRLQRRMDALVGAGMVTVLPFSQVLALVRQEYTEIFNQVKYSFFERGDTIPESRFLTKKRFREELEALRAHAGYDVIDERVVELGKRTVASYAAEEYVIRRCLAREEWCRNPVAIPNEAMFTFPVLANAYLGNEGRGPWLFVMYKGGEDGQL